MNARWHFNLRRASDRMRDSANDAFFTAESLENLSEALVREGIQNSLDAARREPGGVRQVRVRIRFVPSAPQDVRDYLIRHFDTARQNFEQGLSEANLGSLFKNDCGYIAFEDFGTRGLTGDVNEWRLEQAEQNAFFSFFRAEGRSGKSGDSLGRWGIGKQVFPTASRLHAILALTVRQENPTRVLMGSAVVRTHSIADTDYQPDGWFGCRGTPDEPVSPVTEGDLIDEFVATFGLRRGTEQGLSIVVPSVDERLNAADLRRGIVRSFFWPILQGELVVELEADDGTWSIDAETIATHRSLLPSAEAAVVEFATWASTSKPSERITLPAEGASRPSWKDVGEKLLPNEKLDEIRERLATQQRVAIKVPVRVRPKDEREEAMSFVTVFIESCRDAGHRPIFLRDGIVITDVRSPQMPGTRSLVVVDDSPLATLLGDSEGVNHTQWQKDSPKFHGRYVFGPDTIRFVTRSAYEIVQRLHAAETKGDPKLLLDIFFLPTDQGPTEQKKKPVPGKPETTDGLPPDLPPARPQKFQLESVKGGFALKPGKAVIDTFPVRVRIEAGYAVRRGNAVKRWTADDFVFTRPPLRQEPKATGAVVIREDGNQIELEIRGANFQFGVTGFDTKRDLVVRAVEIKSDDEANI